MFWVGVRKKVQKIKINRWATVVKGLIYINNSFIIISKRRCMRFYSTVYQSCYHLVFDQEI
jgi:hypothetical protein